MMTTQYNCGDHLNKMQNAGYDCELGGHATVELRSVTPTHASAHALNGGRCSDACFTMHQALVDKMAAKMDVKQPESPWHRLKTVFLVATIALLVVWVVGYTLLSQLNAL